MSRNLNFELKNAFDQFRRYGSIEGENLMDLVLVLTDINDDLAHARSSACIKENTDKAKALLDKIVESVLD